MRKELVHIGDMSNTLQIKDFHIGICGANWTFDSHYHPSFEVLYCYDGSVSEWMENEKIPFHSGDWLLIPPGMRHYTVNESDTRFTYVSLIFDLDNPTFRKELKSIPRYLITREETIESQLPTYVELLEANVNELVLRDPESPIKHVTLFEGLGLQALILQIVQELVLLSGQRRDRMDHPEASPHEIEVASQIERLLSEFLHNSEVSIIQIAEQVGLSRGQCTKIFSKVFGMAPRHYVSTQRLLQAKEMLLYTDESIQTISDRLGFSSLSHFSRQFKRWTGKSPLQYRPKYRTHYT